MFSTIRLKALVPASAFCAPIVTLNGLCNLKKEDQKLNFLIFLIVVSISNLRNKNRVLNWSFDNKRQNIFFTIYF